MVEPKSTQCGRFTLYFCPVWSFNTDMTMQLTLGLNFQEHGKVEPVKHGDILVTKPFGRVVVLSVDSNNQGEVYLAVRLDTSADCVVLEREVLYRSR